MIFNSLCEGVAMGEGSANSDEKPSVTLPGTVERVIKPLHPGLPEKAQISIEGAEDLYREIRIENVLVDQHGEEVGMKEGAELQVTVEAEPEATTKKA
jgi:hypothetical protein